ncbi:origin recognition complex subunit 5 C-terminus-domain-containing protein [Amylocystis lapponica]|nr:origin recognition complex subunit 5 C-terminus-domain-containing protein [Amylocystis lapponica]
MAATDDLPAGYEHIASDLTLLLTTCSPQFIYIYDAETPRLTCSVLRSVLSALSDTSPQLSYACINAVACFTPRLFYDTVVNTLAHWEPTWENGCANWPGPSADAQRWNESLDAFLHGLRAVYAHAQADAVLAAPVVTGKGKGKARATVVEHDEPASPRLVLVVERAERLRDNLPDLLVPLTRLAELSQIDIVTILTSDVRWEDIRPPLGASPEPYYMDVPTPSKTATLDILASTFSSATAAAGSGNSDPDAYHPALRPLHAHFISTLHSICAPFTRDPHELAYLAAARWPGFIQPVLDAHRAAHADTPSADLAPPPEDTRLRLLRLFTPSFTAALDALYPRHTHAAAWARAHAPPPGLLARPAHQLPPPPRPAPPGAEALPRLAKFVLVAAFLASTNPPRSDVRMFGRGPDERRRRRRKGGSPRKARGRGGNVAVKVPQRLLGPTPFPLDRLLAILGVLLEENDADARPAAPQHVLPGEQTDMKLSRVALLALIMELAAMRLLLRTSPADKADAVPTFKCGISYEVALALGRDLGIIVNDLMWEVL